jgi:hypothetical protein
MINFCRLFFQPCLNRMLSPAQTGKPIAASLIVGAFATLGVLSGVGSDLSGRSSELVFSSAAYAQAVSNNELANYARAVLVMEPVRQTAFNEIKKIIRSGNIPPIVCHRPQSLNALPRNARKIAVNYCNRSKEIVESNGLTINRFNAITVNLQNDPNLKRRIHNELLRIQNP